MTGNTNDFTELTGNVINQLKELNYKNSTLGQYRRIYNRIHAFMLQNKNGKYTPKIGADFLKSTSVSKTTFSSYSCAARRLDDFAAGKEYRCHHGNPKEDVPEIYSEILQDYLKKCHCDGNRPQTIEKKRVSCTLFLRYIEHAGCPDISCLNAETVSRALLIYDNKDNFAIIRMFLGYLFKAGYILKDFSGIVPHYKRGSAIPTTYTADEILMVESSIDTETDTGKRDLTIIRLATRMGLRSGDIARMKLHEINFETGNICIVQEKTGISLVLRMPDAVMEALAKHLENQSPGLQHDDFVFYSMTAPYRPITTRIIRHAVEKYFKAANIDTAGRKHGPHAFRSSLASSMVNDGASYETVRKILGHSDPDTIKHYAKIDIENLRLCAIDPPDPDGIFKEYLVGKKVVQSV